MSMRQTAELLKIRMIAIANRQSVYCDFLNLIGQKVLGILYKLFQKNISRLIDNQAAIVYQGAKGIVTEVNQNFTIPTNYSVTVYSSRMSRNSTKGAVIQ